MKITDSFNILGNIPELDVDPIIDSKYSGHADIKVDPKFFQALWYYADIAHNSKSKIWEKWLEILDVFYNQENIAEAKKLVRYFENKTGKNKELRAGLMTLKYIIENSDLSQIYKFTLTIPEELR